jgi:hypothetical protein
LGAAQPLPNTKPLSFPYAEGQFTDFREPHPIFILTFDILRMLYDNNDV